jgi:adenylate cyclase
MKRRRGRAVTEEEVIKASGEAIDLARLGKIKEAVVRLESLYEEAIKHDLDHALARVCEDLGIVYVERSEFNKAIIWLDRAQAISTDLGIEGRLASVTANKARVYHMQGELDQAITWYMDAHKRLSEIGHQLGIGGLEMNIALVYQQRGDFPLSLEWYYKALESFNAHDYWYGLAKVRGAIGDLYYDTADYEQAIEWYFQALGHYKQHHNDAGASLKHSQIGQALMKLGRVDEAIEELHRGVMISEQHDAHRDLVVALRLQGEAFVLCKQYDDAQSVIERALPLARKLGLQSEIIDCLAVLADLDAVYERPSEAVGKLEEAVVMAETLGHDQQLRYLHERLHRIKRTSDPAAALRHLEKVMELREFMLGEQKQRRLALLEMEHKLSEERKEIESQLEQDRALREQQRALLTNMMPEVIADRLMSEEGMIADSHDNVSILFLDLVNFTGLASHVSPAVVVHVLNQIFQTCDEVVRALGITKIKTSGDAYLAIAGAPHAMENSAVVMAHAALTIRDRLAALHISIPSEFGDSSAIDTLQFIEARLGLNFGSITAGVIGDDRKAYDVWGDAVNVAARMEQTSETGRIQASEHFVQQIKDETSIRCILRGEVAVKGKGTMQTYWLERPRDQ